jgi:hypothetical protein
MGCGGFSDVGLGDGVLELTLQGGFMQVMAGNPSGPGMRAESGRGKDVLPGPFPGCARPFTQQAFRHVDFTGSDGQILEVFV